LFGKNNLYILKWREALIQIEKNIDMVKNFFLSLNDGVVMNQLIHFKFLVIANQTLDDLDIMSFPFDNMLI
jgi:hypothetical protein